MEIDRSKIKLVDGFKIRNTLDDDFAVFHVPSMYAHRFAPKFYIPDGEWWFDHQFEDELEFIVGMELLNDELIEKERLSYAEARKKVKELFCKKGELPEFKKDRQEKDGYTVIMVDGKIVREYIDPEFVFGGHEFVYDYVPKGEVWLDMRMNPAEIPYIQLHEEYERNLMREGKNYDVAHDFATVADKEMRRNDGVGIYPGEPNYPWWGLTNEELAQKYYVDESIKSEYEHGAEAGNETRAEA